MLIKFSGGVPPDPPFKQNCLSLYCNHNTANHLKKFKHIPKSTPPPNHFSGELKIKGLCMSYLKSPLLIIFSRMDVWKNRKKSLKMYLKSRWKVLEKGMSWSVGTMVSFSGNVSFVSPSCDSAVKSTSTNPAFSFDSCCLLFLYIVLLLCPVGEI